MLIRDANDMLAKDREIRDRKCSRRIVRSETANDESAKDREIRDRE